MSSKSLLAFLFGAAAGAAATYFMTSEKMSGTRAELREKAEEKLAPVRQKVVEGLEMADEKLAPARQRLIEGLEKAEKALEDL